MQTVVTVKVNGRALDVVADCFGDFAVHPKVSVNQFGRLVLSKSTYVVTYVPCGLQIAGVSIGASASQKRSLAARAAIGATQTNFAPYLTMEPVPTPAEESWIAWLTNYNLEVL